jgi:hypothetical protein
MISGICSKITLGVALVCLVGLVVSLSPAAAREEIPATAVLIIDHTMVDAAQISQAGLDGARQLDIFFAHRSVGGNILDGLADWQGQDPLRYTLPITIADPSWFADNNGLLHRLIGVNGQPYSKIEGFDTFVQDGYWQAEIAMMKFCPSDTLPFGVVPAVDIWTAYHQMMTALEQTYPNVTFVWWTMPLATAADDRGNDEKEIFNALVRTYCAAQSCVLFDIADIESHDPQGNPVISAAGYEAMWNGYAYDGAHLNEVGRQRVAAAFWWLFARLSGWDGNQARAVYLPVILGET